MAYRKLAAADAFWRPSNQMRVDGDLLTLRPLDAVLIDGPKALPPELE